MNIDSAETSHWFDLGDVAVVPLIEIRRLPIDPAEFFPTAEIRADWYREPPWFDAYTGDLLFVIQSFAVCSAQGVILVDGCVGAGKSRKRSAFNRLPARWWRQFDGAGLSATDVTAFIFTHLHVDHVGAATINRGSGWQPAFPGVPHYAMEAEFSYWTSDAGQAALQRTGDYMTDSVLPVQRSGDLVLLQTPTTIDTRVRLRLAVGHTPGNLVTEIDGARGTILLTGDTLHHPLQLADPDISSRYCVSASGAADVRRGLLEEATRSDTAIVPSHFAAPSIGRTRTTGAGYTFERATDLIRWGRFDYRAWRESPALS